MGPVSLLQLQIGLLASAKDLQSDLRQLASTADTSSSSGLQRVLQDTTLAGLIIVFNWSITTDNHCHRHFRHNHHWLDRLQTCTDDVAMS